MAYYINLEKMSIIDLKERITTAYLIPSWKILLDNIESRMETLNKYVSNVKELQLDLKSKKKMLSFAAKCQLDDNYLTILRRFINSYEPKPAKFKDFTRLDEKIIDKLQIAGFTDTFKLYEEVLTKEQREILSKKTGIDEQTISMLTSFSDFCRIRWVNHTFANLLFEAGYTSVEEISKEDYHNLHTRILELNQKKEMYKGNLGSNDMRLCVEISQELDIDIIW